MRNCEVLSMTTAPFFAALGEYSADTLAPGEENTSSVPLKSKVARFCTFTSSAPKEISLPTERSEASAAMSSTGNARSASVFIISRPTAPVAPTTAILYPIGFYLCAFRFLCLTDQAAAACCGSAGSAPLAAPVHGCCEIPLVRPLTRKAAQRTAFPRVHGGCAYLCAVWPVVVAGFRTGVDCSAVTVDFEL